MNQPQQAAAPPAPRAQATPYPMPFGTFNPFSFALPGGVRTVCEPWMGFPPSLMFWSSLVRAQASAPVIVRDEKVKDSKAKYAPVEEFIKLKKVFLDAGLFAFQPGGLLEPRGESQGLTLSTAFIVLCPTDGTGLLCRVEWPAHSFMGGKGSAGHATATAYTMPWKYWIRGMLGLDQVDDDDQLERNEPSPYERQQGPQAPPRQQPQHGPPPQQAPAYGPPPQAAQAYGPPAQQRPFAPVPHPGESWQQPGPQYGPPPGPQYQQQPGPQYGGPQHGPPPQQRQARPPIEQEPIVQATHQMLGGEPVNAPNPRPVERPRPADGGPDATYEDLLGRGWRQDFALALASIGANDTVPVELREEFMSATSEYFGEDRAAAMALWEGTGFAPSGPSGPKPTGAQLRRYCVKLDWRRRNATAAQAQ